MLAGHAVQHKYVAKVFACTATCLTAGLVASHAPFRYACDLGSYLYTYIKAPTKRSLIRLNLCWRQACPGSKPLLTLV